MERTADPTLIPAAEPVLLPPLVLEGPVPLEVLVPEVRVVPELAPEGEGVAPEAVGRAA